VRPPRRGYHPFFVVVIIIIIIFSISTLNNFHRLREPRTGAWWGVARVAGEGAEKMNRMRAAQQGRRRKKNYNDISSSPHLCSKAGKRTFDPMRTHAAKTA
jgi:hypothetical protein